MVFSTISSLCTHPPPCGADGAAGLAGAGAGFGAGCGAGAGLLLPWAGALVRGEMDPVDPVPPVFAPLWFLPVDAVGAEAWARKAW